MRETSINPLPKTVKEMNLKKYYTIIENECTESRIEIEMIISLIVMKLRINTIKSFSEYWKYEGR